LGDFQALSAGYICCTSRWRQVSLLVIESFTQIICSKHDGYSLLNSEFLILIG